MMFLMLFHGGNETYYFWNASSTLCQMSYSARLVRVRIICEPSFFKINVILNAIMIFIVSWGCTQVKMMFVVMMR